MDKICLDEHGWVFYRFAIDEPKYAISKNDIQNVYFNPTKKTTVVKWKNGTITKVKCQDGDTYNPELGLAMCLSKKALGNRGNYNDVFNKWLPKEDK